MGIGDMLQAQFDAEDAKRYRWLRNQYARGKQTYFAEKCASDCSRNPQPDSIKKAESMIDGDIDKLMLRDSARETGAKGG